MNATLTLSAPDKRPGDVFVNRLSSGENSTSATEMVISRALEGVVWRDLDKNGERNNGEELITGVKVTLMKLNGSTYEQVKIGSEPVTCTVGKVKNVLTGEETGGEAGHYRFFGLEAGTYGVRIESGTGNEPYDISHDKVTDFRASGVMDQVNNDAVGTYDSGTDILLHADISGIVMPTKDTLTSLKQSQYVSYQNDAGLYPEVHTLTYHVAGDATYGTPSDSVIPDPVTGIPYGENVNLANVPVTSWGTSDGTSSGIPGAWTFTRGWSSNTTYADELTRVENITEDKNVYGKWTFTPGEYTLTYHVEGDDLYGVPSDSVTPAQITGIEYNGSVAPLADVPTTEWTTSNGKSTGIPGTWTFTPGWSSDTTYSDKLSEVTGIRKGENVYGKWTFTPELASITVLNATIAQYYTAYQVFGLNGDGEYIYTSRDHENDSFLDALLDEDDGGKFFTLILTDDPNVFTVKVKDEAAEEDIVGFFSDHYRDIKNNVDEFKPSGVIADKHQVKFENLEFGYYYVYSSLGTAVTLSNVNKDVKVIDKNEGPSWDNKIDDPDDPNMPDPSDDPHNPEDAPGPGPGKVILEYPLTNGEPDYTKTPTRVMANSVNFGDIVKFSIAITATAYEKDELVTYYYITDKLASGFTYVVDETHPIVVTVTEQERNNKDTDFGTYHDAVKHTLILNAYENAESFIGGNAYIMDAAKETFSADADREFVIAVPFGTQYGVRAKIEVTYFARINTDGTDVVLGADGNLNTADFFWQLDPDFDPDDPDYTSHTPDTTKGYPVPDDDVIPDPNSDENDPKNTKTYVFGLLVYKYTETDSNKTPLSGAKFRLVDTNTEAAVKISGSDGVYIYDKDSAVTEVVSNADGNIYIEGLKEGTYTLREIEAPIGYNPVSPSDYPVLTFSRSDANTTYTAHGPSMGCDYYVSVENKAGVLLPETGGKGTRRFILFGAMLAFGGGIFWLTNVRVRKERWQSEESWQSEEI